MTEINIPDFFNYDKASVVNFLQILKEKEFKIIIPRNMIKIEPLELTGAVDYDGAAYAGQLLANITRRFAYYVPCPYTTDPFHFMVTIRNRKAFAELLYVIIQVFNPNTSETDIITNFLEDGEIFFEQYCSGTVISNAVGLLLVSNRLEEPVEEYCVWQVKKRIVIQVSQFTKYNSADLYAHLLTLQASEFEIIIPKTPDPQLLMFDFLRAAYAGHLLSEGTNNFAFFVPAPGSEQPFYFHITVHNFETFTDTLYTIIQGCDDSSGKADDFDYEAAMFAGEAYQEGSDCKTMALLQVAMQLFA